MDEFLIRELHGYVRGVVLDRPSRLQLERWPCSLECGMYSVRARLDELGNVLHRLSHIRGEAKAHMKPRAARTSHLAKRRHVHRSFLSTGGFPSLGFDEHSAELLDRELERERGLLEILCEHSVQVHVERLEDVLDWRNRWSGVRFLHILNTQNRRSERSDHLAAMRSGVRSPYAPPNSRRSAA